jgi:hypothetical protein
VLKYLERIQGRFDLAAVLGTHLGVPPILDALEKGFPHEEAILKVLAFLDVPVQEEKWVDATLDHQREGFGGDPP